MLRRELVVVDLDVELPFAQDAQLDEADRIQADNRLQAAIGVELFGRDVHKQVPRENLFQGIDDTMLHDKTRLDEPGNIIRLETSR